MTDKQEDFVFTNSMVATYTDIITPATYVKGKPKIIGPGPNARYSATFIIAPDHPDFVRLKAGVIGVLMANLGGKKPKVGLLTEEQEKAQTHASVLVPWSDGTVFADEQKAKGKDAEYARGKMRVKATSKFPPQLSALLNGVPEDFITAEAIALAAKYFYSGARLAPTVAFNWYKGDTGKPSGVSLYLQTVMFVKDGPRLGGGSRRSAAETFKGVLGSIKDEDPTGGAGSADELDDL